MGDKGVPNHKYFLGIDNGTSGTLAIVGGGESYFIKTPIKLEQSYTLKKQNISRVKVHEFVAFIKEHSEKGKIFAVLERPLVNPSMFRATMSAMRTLEAEQILLEALDIPFMFIDSKRWQKYFLPTGTKGTPALKKASLDIGCKLFPEHKILINRHKDADGLLIAEWARRNNL